MGREDQTWMSEFILLGLSSCWESQVSLFVLFLAMYLMTVLRNFLIILLIRLDSRLNTPMYVFLSILSFVDICYINSTVPRCSFTSCQPRSLSHSTAVCSSCYLLGHEQPRALPAGSHGL